MATAGLLMNRACASLVSALRVSIPVADGPSARACRRSCSPASLRHRAAPAIPTPPSIAGGPGHSLWRAGLWPWRSAAASGPLAVGRLSYAHTQEPPCGLSPPGGHKFPCVVNPTPVGRGSENLSSSPCSTCSLPRCDLPLVDLRLCSSARLARGSGRQNLLDDSLAALGAM